MNEATESLTMSSADNLRPLRQYARSLLDEFDREQLHRVIDISRNGAAPVVEASTTPPPKPVETVVPIVRRKPRLHTGAGLFAIVSRAVRAEGVAGITAGDLHVKLLNSGEIGNNIEVRHLVGQLNKSKAMFIKRPNERWVYRKLLRENPTPVSAA